MMHNDKSIFVNVPLDFLSIQDFFKGWLHDCGTDSEHFHLLLPSKGMYTIYFIVLFPDYQPQKVYAAGDSKIKSSELDAGKS